jgi:hypothetical protein
MATFLDLPDEILVWIADHVLPADLINFCCTCKRSYRCSVQALPRYHHMSETLYSIDDQDPQRLLGLLRSLAFDKTQNPIFANPMESSTAVEPSDSFYIREFEIYEPSRAFTGGMYPHGRVSQHPTHETFPDDILTFEDGELQSYRNACQRLLKLPDADVQSWIREIVQGCDKAVKTILMALLPKLETLTFVQHVVMITGPRPSRNSNQSLQFLVSALRQLSSLPRSDWSCFQSLRSVTLGVNSRPYHGEFHYTVRDAAPLLLLPNLVNLRLNMIVDDGKDYSWEWEPRISSCERLSIQPGEEMSIDSISGLLRAVKNIKHLILGGCKEWSHNPRFADYLLEHGRESLEYLHVTPAPELAYQTMFKRLTHFEIRLRNLFTPVQIAPLFSDLNKQRLYAQNEKSKLVDDAASSTTNIWINLASRLPPSVETIKLTNTVKPLLYGEAADLVKMLEKVIQAKATRLTKLRGLCIVDVTSETGHPKWATRSARRSLLVPSVARIEVSLPYTCDEQRRETGIHYWAADLRHVAARHAVEIHTDPLEECIGPGSTLFCQLRDLEGHERTREMHARAPLVF